MNKSKLASIMVPTLSLWASTTLANPADHAERAAQASGRASANTSASVGHSLAATGQLTSGVIATPMLASGTLAVSAGSAAVQAGGSLMDAASRPIGKPLPVADETISILPPNKALQKPAAGNN